MSERELGAGGVGEDPGVKRRIRGRGSLCDLPTFGMQVVELGSLPSRRQLYPLLFLGVHPRLCSIPNAQLEIYEMVQLWIGGLGDLGTGDIPSYRSFD